MKKDLGRALTYVLRHAPQEIGIELDEAGWADVARLLSAFRRAGYAADIEKLKAVVASDSKQRFTLSPDGKRIRAAQGHSVKVVLGLEPIAPPDVLYHGTATTNLDSIFVSGLLPGKRQQVHLSADVETATKVGSRHGRAIVLAIDCSSMLKEKIPFYRADNGVWLVDSVPAKFISFYA